MDKIARLRNQSNCYFVFDSGADQENYFTATAAATQKKTLPSKTPYCTCSYLDPFIQLQILITRSTKRFTYRFE